MTTEKNLADLLPDANALRDVADTRRAQAMREAAARAVDDLDHRRTPVVTPRPLGRKVEPATEAPLPRPEGKQRPLPRRIYALAAFTLAMPFATVAMVEVRDQMRGSPAFLHAAAFVAPVLPSAPPSAPPVVAPSASAPAAPSAAEAPSPAESSHPPRSTPSAIAQRTPAPHPTVAPPATPAPPSPASPPPTVGSAVPAPAPSTPLAPSTPSAAPRPTSSARSSDWSPGRATFVRPSREGKAP